MIKLFLTALSLVVLSGTVSGSADSLSFLSGTVYDEMFHPVPHTHVIGLYSGFGDITDSLGIFEIPLINGDTLLFKNIAFRDTFVAVSDLKRFPSIIIKSRYYSLPEAKIFDWGSSYNDFKKAITDMPKQESLGESMGLPRQDPDYIPFDMNEKVLKSAAFLIKKPVSYFYYNFSKREKSARKVYWRERNREQIEQFESFVNEHTVSEITRMEGEDLEKFMIYLNSNLICDFHCSELEIISEIHYLWNIYQEK